MPTAESRIRVHELVAAIVEQQPDYAGFLAGDFEEVFRASRGFIARLVRAAARDSSTTAPRLVSGIEQALFEEIGRIHYQQRREIGPLLGAYRAGAAVAWRHVADTAVRRGVPAEMVAGLAAVVFAAVDQLSSASVRGYVQAQASGCHVRERGREELAELLLSDRSDPRRVRVVADRVGWPLPRRAAVVQINPDKETSRTLLERLDDSCLRLRRGQELVVIVPDPDGPGRRARPVTVLRGAAAVVGASVPLDRLPASVELVGLAAGLQQARVLGDDPLFVDEHLPALVVHRDAPLLTALRRQCLAPLDALPESTRDRLSVTLRSWLLNMGNYKVIAGELHVHPCATGWGGCVSCSGPALTTPPPGRRSCWHWPGVPLPRSLRRRATTRIPNPPDHHPARPPRSHQRVTEASDLSGRRPYERVQW
jgi:hypothetical protein